ncbi:hypothetical protein NPX13_g11157 [Xylaria arbuscula]|uniref:Uncharacterized protein n=1 Tax=Xylaria arbuscula TaxID=114810 RepID=A0A9W8N3C9_9PEZI|nr:hypothetical protein NPX13_g11157 [Xylaria arbuscula]
MRKSAWQANFISDIAAARARKTQSSAITHPREASCLASTSAAWLKQGIARQGGSLNNGWVSRSNADGSLEPVSGLTGVGPGYITDPRPRYLTASTHRKCTPWSSREGHTCRKWDENVFSYHNVFAGEGATPRISAPVGATAVTTFNTTLPQLPTRPLSEGAHTSQALPLPPYGYSIPPSSHQPHQHYQGFPSNTPPPLSTPSPSQFMQPLREPRDMNHMKNPKRFPSPDVDHEAQLSGFSRDVALVADAVQQACPEAVRRVVRDKWEKCVVGSEFHHAFLMNAAIHNASGVIMRRAIRDFGQHMVLGAKKEIASHLRPEDLDELAPIILEKCSDRFLDKALEQRLKTIDARSLINALARAERLGYEKGDILEGQPEGQPERVVPAAQTHSPGVTQVNLQTSSHPQFPAAGPGTNALAHPVQPLAHHAPPIADLKCKLCWREFRHSKHYEYHVQKQLCTRAASGQQSQFVCDACGAEFATKHGQQYHVERAVCGPHITAPATPKSEGPPSVTHHHFIPPIPPSNSQPQPPQPPYPPQPLHPTLSQPISSPVGNPSPSSDDPYAHLTPEKRFQLDEELRLAEINFSPRFHEAMAIVDLKARQQKIDSLNNSFSTKQRD